MPAVAALFSHSKQQQSASPSLKLFFHHPIVVCSLEPNKLILIPSPKVVTILLHADSILAPSSIVF